MKTIKILDKELEQKKYIYFLIVILIFILLSTAFVLINPIFEANDESGHFQYAFYISKYNRIPSAYNEPISREDYIESNIGEKSTQIFYMDEKYMFYWMPANQYNDQMHHPPLYYLISSQIIKPFKINNIYAENNWPYCMEGGQPNAHKNNIIWENFTPTYMLVLILRMFQVIYGIFIIIFIYKILKLILGDNIDKYSILLISSIAFLPQYTFLCSYVNNDVLSYLFGLISVYFIILLFKTNKTYFTLLAIFFSIVASFTKFTMLIMIPLTIIASIAWAIIAKRKWILLAIFIIPVVIIGSFYIFKDQNLLTLYIRNHILDRGRGVLIGFSNSLSKYTFFNETLAIKMPRSLKSTIGYFGGFFIPVNNFIYNFYAAYIISGLILFFISIKRHKKIYTSIVFICISIILIFIYFFIYASIGGQIQGRIFFLAVILTFILLILGYKNIKIPFKKTFYYSLFSYFLFINIFCIYNYIYLNYY